MRAFRRDRNVVAARADNGALRSLDCRITVSVVRRVLRTTLDSRFGWPLARLWRQIILEQTDLLMRILRAHCVET